MDDTNPSGSGFTNPFDLRSGSRTGSKQFSLTNTRKAPGLPVWTAPQGATVTGGCPTVMSVETCRKYVFDQPVGEDTGDEKTRRRDAILSRVAGAFVKGVDDPAAAGVSFTGGKGDVALDHPFMALLGEPLDAMVQNLGQTNNGYVSADTTNDVLSQGFTTGNATYGYRLQGIGVNIEGSGSNYPDGPTSVSVAVHANSNGQPGAKLVDLVSPTEYAAGHSFFEAPPGTHLRKDTSYVLVWSHLGGTVHRLRKTGSNGEDSGGHITASIADVFYRGADLDNLSANSSNALEIAVYTESNTETVVYITPPPQPPEEHEIPFEPGLTGGGGAILRCFVQPPDTCPSYDDVVPGEITLWSATLTVGKIGIGFTQAIGYEAKMDPVPFGTLSNNTVSLAGRSYTVDSLKIEFPTIVNRLNLLFSGDPGDIAPGDIPNNLTLHLGSTSLRLSNATSTALGDGYSLDQPRPHLVRRTNPSR